MGFNKNRLNAYLNQLFVKTGVILSAMAIAIFFLDVVKVIAFTGKYQATIQSDSGGGGSQGDMEDEEEEGQVSPTLVSISKNYIPDSAPGFFYESFLLVSDSKQSPPDFPPEVAWFLLFKSFSV